MADALWNKIGGGRTGGVYEAVDRQLGCVVAVKMASAASEHAISLAHEDTMYRKLQTHRGTGQRSG